MFVVFPLFMAGLVNQHAAEREEILSLMRKLEEDSIGRNMIATRQLLEIVYERRSEQRKRQEREKDASRKNQVQGTDIPAFPGDSDFVPDDVDWVGMIGELGLQVVNCRL